MVSGGQYGPRRCPGGTGRREPLTLGLRTVRSTLIYFAQHNAPPPAPPPPAGVVIAVAAPDAVINNNHFLTVDPTTTPDYSRNIKSRWPTTTTTTKTFIAQRNIFYGSSHARTATGYRLYTTGQLIGLDNRITKQFANNKYKLLTNKDENIAMETGRVHCNTSENIPPRIKGKKNPTPKRGDIN